MFIGTWWSLMPPIIAILLALLTKEVYLSLFAGCALGALLVAEQLGIAPADFLYLGDTKVDMTCACSAGMNPVGVLWGFRTAQELLDNGAKVLIAHPMELLEKFNL